MVMMMSVYSEYQCVCVILHMSVITQNGRPALIWAARWGKTEVVVELVKAGANVDMQDNVCQYIYVTHDVNVQNHTEFTTSAMLSILGERERSYWLQLCRMLCMHNHVLKAVQKHNTKRSCVSLCTLRAGV